jgi:hypothetical protein
VEQMMNVVIGLTGRSIYVCWCRFHAEEVVVNGRFMTNVLEQCISTM